METETRRSNIIAIITEDRRKLLAAATGALILVGTAGFLVGHSLVGDGTEQVSSAAPSEGAKGAEPLETATPATPGAVAMSPERIAGAGIATEVVAGGGLGAEIVSQGTVSAAATGEAVVTARAGGAITRVLKRLGDPVRAGEALAILESREAAQFAADRSAAAAKANLAQRNLAREQYLYRQKVSPRVDLEQAQAEAAAAAAEARRAQAAARASNITSDGRGLVVQSPISGRITAISARLGTFVQAEAELFRVSDPRQIQVEAAVSAADASRLAPGDRAIIELQGGGTVNGRVRTVTPTVSSETRAATAILDVGGASLPPGLAVAVRLLPSRSQRTSAIVVPEEAVQSVNGRDVVFVRTTSGFRAQPVTTGQRSAGRIEIVSGLTAGQTIATGSAFLLKAELAKPAGEEE